MAKFKKYTYLILLLIIASSCIETFEFKTASFDANLVVRAIITNELKQHTVELSRTIPIDSTKLDPERNAIVSITNDAGEMYNFQETQDGIYTSNVDFAILPNIAYTLNIETQDGNTYNSTPETLPKTSTIQDLEVSVQENDIDQIKEVVIKANSNTSGNEGQYYRYAYEETFKVKTAVWSPKKLVILSNTPPYSFELVDKDPNIDGIGFCYGTLNSKNILLTETLTLAQDQIIGFPIRKIPIDNYIVGIRYSILVKQYVINQNTYDFYTLLNTFSNPDNIFSQTQVGNIPSNISSTTNPTEDKVIGFFEVSSIATERIFFNRNEIADTFTGFNNYVSLADCTERPNPFITGPFGNSPLLDLLLNGWIYQSPPDTPIIPPERPYALTVKPCGDCTHIGAPIPPSFWVE
ncbi:DUF4249 domain-containing protein [Tenacibaculum amylolyticum]|uniref:DUF4249 domain-containing protein n=1 Tax=Tenacibaculum amylolyticum TaxID=104269 RepID=UPI003893D130